MTLRIFRVMIRNDSVRPLTELVSAVSPLDGDALDGSERPKSRRTVGPRREPQDRSLTFFCSNPQCDHATWSPAEQARHMAREFWEVTQALVQLAPDSPEALKLTGDLILRDLTDDECREGATEALRHRRRAEKAPLQVQLIANEYIRRARSRVLCTIGPEEQGRRRRERNDRERGIDTVLTDDVVRAAFAARSRLTKQGLPVPDDIDRAARECVRRKSNGSLKPLSGEQVLQRRAAGHAARDAALPSLAERRSRRLMLGLSAAEAGARIGVTPQTITAWERGAKVPDSEEAVAAYCALLSSADPGQAVSSVASTKRAARHAEWPPARIKALRARLGLTQPQFAQRLGLADSKSAIQRWERGVLVPLPSSIRQLNALVSSLDGVR